MVKCPFYIVFYPSCYEYIIVLLESMINSLHAGDFASFFVVCGIFFFFFFFFFLTINFVQKKSFRNTIRVSNSLDPDQARRFVGPDLSPNYLQRLSADDKSHH